MKILLVLTLILTIISFSPIHNSFTDEEKIDIYELTNVSYHDPDLTFNLPYSIHNGAIEDIQSTSTSNIIEISSDDDGLLEITIPKNLHHVQNNYDPEGLQIILVDGIETKFEQTATECDITYVIPFSKNSKLIEVIPTVTLGSDPMIPYVESRNCLAPLSSGTFIEFLISNNLGKHLILHNDKQFEITYSMSPEIKINNVLYDPDANSLIFSINAKSDGVLFASIPHQLISFGYMPGCYYDEWFVLLDGEELHPFEEKLKQTTRIIKIPFKENLKEIEIINNYVYGPSSPRLMSCIDEMQHEMNPREQVVNGVLSENIVCKSDLELIFKNTGDSPACVNPESIPKLVERGWGHVR